VLNEVSNPAVDTDYGYHIMLYRGDEKPAWSHTIRVELAEGTYEAWLEDSVKNTTFTDNTANSSYTDMIG